MAGKTIPACTGKHLFSLLLALALSTLSFAQNPIVTENALAGNPYSEWGIPDSRDNRIAGFATQMSLNVGQTVHFKINVQGAATYTLKIYRIGYYGGNGARLKQNLGTLTGVVQPAGFSDPATGLLDCDNWSESAQWAIPANAVSGLYIAKLERTGGGSNHIVFIVRSDASNSDLYLQFPDATWQAYNAYGGSSVYDGTVANFPNGHATKVSYNRPFFIYNSLFNLDGRGSDWYMNAEYPMVRWLERNGYNVSYTSCEDISGNPAHLLTHKVYISVGHDEYVSKEQRNNVEAARNAGVNLAFFSGNEFYWKTRYENDASGDARRTLVCYKEGLLGDGTYGERTCGTKCDISSPEWTGLWRTGGDYDGGRPENALIGQISWDETPGEIQVPASYKKLRFWRNTSVAGLAAGQTATLAPNTLGYEWDWEHYPDSYPAGRITMSSTTLNNRTHKLSLYRHSSGALVFGAGTVQWSWGLDDAHLGGSPVVSKDMQQATVNLFADMGVQPATLQSGLIAGVKSTDLTAPSSIITSPANGASFPANSNVTVSGTATDAGGGVVAGVEVSVDGGTTWQQATINVVDGSITWSFSFTPSQGAVTVKTRAFDDSGNKETPGAGINLTIDPPVCPCTLFKSTDAPAAPYVNDGQGIIVGMKFRAAQSGSITGIRYYKGFNTTGVHTGQLWSNTGTLLAQVTFTNETASGWQQALFSTPVSITANTTYIVSYHSPSGDYAATNPYFTQSVVNSQLRGLANGEDGPNGVYAYSATPVFPTSNHQSDNYWVDIVYTTTIGPDNTPPVVSSVSPLNGTTAVNVNATVSAIFSEAINNSTVTGITFQLKDAANNIIPASVITSGSQITLTPSAALNNLIVYTATIKGGASGVKDLAGNPLASDYTWSFTTAPAPSGSSIFQPTDIPAVLHANDGQAIILGMKFRSSENGSVTGIRYYKGSGTTGVHTGQLWSSTGTLLAQATFTGESASGWQEVLFSTPVSITANTTYIASYHSPSGDYTGTNPYFTQAVVNGPLRALASGEDGPNGIYLYSATPVFPVNNHETDNYWVDVVFKNIDNVPPTVTTVSPVNGATGVSVSTTVTATFSEAIDASTVNNATIQLKTGSTVIPVSITMATNQITLTPSVALMKATVYTVTITGGAPGVKDLTGNPLASNYSWSFTTDNTAPTITTVTPVNAATGVALNSALTAIFSEPMDAATINESTFQLTSPSSGAIVATVTYNASARTATLSPTAALASGTVYTAKIVGGTSGVKDVAGNELANDYAWSFTTIVVDNTPPTVVSVTPANGSMNVSGGASVSVIFSEAMLASTITTTNFELRNPLNALVTATVTYNAATRTATLIPSSNLTMLTTYTATMKGGASGVKDAAGNALVSNYAWSFTTAILDLTAPTVTTVTPANGSTGVAISTALTAVFSEAMTASTITATNVQLRNAANTLITATVAYSAATRTVTLTPSAALTGGAVYTATVKGGSSGVKDAAGNALASNYVWSFTTFVVDNTPPTVTSVTPVNGATGVSNVTTVSAIFSEAMNASTIITTNVELRDPSSTLITAIIAYNATTRTVTLTPSAALTGATIYTATIKGGSTGVKDAAGNALANNFVWSFTTVDNIPPTVTSVTPINGATGVSVSTTITAIFNEVMNAATITTTNVELRNPANTLITATIAYNATTRTATLTPSAALTGNTVYTATVKSGSTGVKDAAGNALASNYVWSFMTVAVDNTPPTVTSVTPVNGTTDVNTGATVTAIFSEAMTASTITITNIELRNSSNVLVSATVSYNAGTKTATLTPSVALANGTVYTATVKGGSSGVKDVAGNALVSNYAWSFTTIAASSSGISVFAPTSTPAIQRANDGQPIELGMKFRSTQDGNITALRYYKGTGTTGVHTGHLWSSIGTLLGQVTFTNESASGWQQATLATPVAIVANTTYIVSYFSPSGDYAATNPYFTTAVINGSLRGLANGEDGPNGVYKYTASSAFPNTNHQTDNYWADVVFEQNTGLITGLISVLGDVVGGLSRTIHSRIPLNGVIQNRASLAAPLQPEEILTEGKTVMIAPNPSSSYFTISIRSSEKDPVTVRVSDVFGRIVERRDKIAPVSTLQLGHTWRTGTYFVEVVQGNERKIIKLIKMN